MSNTYTNKDLPETASYNEISRNDVVMLNGNCIVSSINIVDPIDGKINPIPSYDAVLDVAKFLSGEVSSTIADVSSTSASIESICQTIDAMSVDCSLVDGSQVSIITHIGQLSGKTSIQAKSLLSSDINQLSGFVDGKVGELKHFTTSNYLPLSGGILTGDLSIDRDYALCVDNSSRFVVGNQSLCALLSNELLLSTSNAISRLSIDLSNDFDFEFDRESNMISARVAGKTLAFSADKFTEAKMISAVGIVYRGEDSDKKPYLQILFKTESGIEPVEISLLELMTLYHGQNGIDIQYDSSIQKYVVSADSTVCRRTDISNIVVDNTIELGKILSSLKQENGVVSYGTAPILSSYVEGLPEYVDYALSNYNAPLSTVYGDWHIYQSDPSDPTVDELRLSTTTEAGIDKIWYAPFSNGQQLADFQELLDPYYIKFPENGRIHETVTMRKADHYILGNHINQPIQPKIQFGMLSTLDAYPLDSSLNFDSPLSTVISAVVAIRDTIKQLRDSIEHLSA